MSKMQKAAVAAVLASGLGTSAGAVTPIFLQSAGIYNPGTTLITTGASSSNDYATDVIFHANSGTSSGLPAFDLAAFCVDLFHNITVGIGYQYAVNLAYHAAPLTTDSHGHTLSALQKNEIGGLANLGFQIQTGSAADKYDSLAAIQGAIWTVEYPGSTIAASGGYGDLQSRINSYVALAPSLHGTPYAIYPTGGSTQGFVVGQLARFTPGSPLLGMGAVPEPKTWGLMLAGFGLVGLSARRRSATRIVTA